jgi:exopolyphosphatase/guanosine-5'-triphosphate,3'-diphosphate pyrophosphatase
LPTFAAVDIGANSVRLKVARLVRRRLRTLLEDREVVRLGESVFQAGMLAPATMARTVKVLRRFRKAVDQFGDVRVRVTATSALRAARNAQTFMDWVHVRTGWDVEVISGVEEARLIHLGIISNLRVTAWPLLLMDLGGGSCELTISEHGHIRDTVSLPLGAVRLTQEFLRHDPPEEYELHRLRTFIGEQLAPTARHIARIAPATVVATSGTAAALAGGKPAAVAARDIVELAEELAQMPYAERIRRPGIGTRRGEIIVAGAAVFAELMERCRLRGFRYSELGLRDGLLAEMAAGLTRGAATRQLEADRADSLHSTARRYGVDMAQAEHVCALAMQLFTALKSAHHLPPAYASWLTAAAMLHEAGAWVNRTGWHRHAWYIIANSDLLGYTPEQRRVIAAITRYLGTATPSANDKVIKALGPQDRREVPKAIAILRLARALNQGRHRAVALVSARSNDGRIVLRVKTRRGEADLELWALRKERAYFRAVFGRELDAELS